MKKLITLSVLAMTLMLASNEKASAWSNIKFGAGVNLHWQTGDNNFLWGFFRNGQIPGPGPYGYAPGGQGEMPFFGAANPSDMNKQPLAAPAPPATTGVNQANYPPNSSYYQPVGYYPNSPYQVPMYTPNYYPYQAPAYWYGQ